MENILNDFSIFFPTFFISKICLPWDGSSWFVWSYPGTGIISRENSLQLLCGPEIGADDALCIHSTFLSTLHMCTHHWHSLPASQEEDLLLLLILRTLLASLVRLLILLASLLLLLILLASLILLLLLPLHIGGVAWSANYKSVNFTEN